MGAPSGQPQRLAVLWLGLLGVIGLLAFAASPFFAITEVQVVGAELLDPAEVQALAGVRPGENWLLVRTGLAARRLEADPRIAAARVVRRWPPHLRIEVSERRPVARVLRGGQLWALDAEAVLLPAALALADTPIVTGADAEAWAVGEPVRSPQVLAGARVAARLPPSLRAEISEIHSADPANLVLVTRNLVTVELGSLEELEIKLQVLASILERVRQLGRPVGFIDLREPRTPVVR